MIRDLIPLKADKNEDAEDEPEEIPIIVQGVPKIEKETRSRNEDNKLEIVNTIDVNAVPTTAYRIDSCNRSYPNRFRPIKVIFEKHHELRPAIRNASLLKNSSYNFISIRRSFNREGQEKHRELVRELFERRNSEDSEKMKTPLDVTMKLVIRGASYTTKNPSEQQT